MNRAGGVTDSMTTQTSFRITRDLLDRVNEEARRRVVGRSMVINAAIAEWLERHGEEEV